MQKLGRKFLKLFLLFPAWLKLGSLKWAYRLAQENFSPRDLAGLEVKSGNLVSSYTGITADDSSYRQIKGGMHYWVSFAQYEGISHFGMEAGKLVTTVDGVKFQIDHPGSLFVLDEIFAERLYDLRVTEDLVLIDVGMNIGAASLYFSTRPNILHVFSYEPLRETYEQALVNIQLNPSLVPRITPVQKGVSNYSGAIEVPTAEGGSAVFSTDKDFIGTLGTDSEKKVTVEIVPVVALMDDIEEKFPGKRIFLKLDCEGEEYKIMDALSVDGRLDKIAVIALEWHFKGFASLCLLLEQHNFSVFNLGRKDIKPPCGMIYAFNMKNQTYA